MVDSTVILAGAIPAALLALVADGLLTWFERAVSPRRRPAPRARWWRPSARWRSCAVRSVPGWPRSARGRRSSSARRTSPSSSSSASSLAQAIERDGLRGRSPAEPGRHAHLRPRAARRRHRRLRGVHWHGPHRDLPPAGPARSGRRCSTAVRQDYAETGRTLLPAARLQQHVRDPRARADARRLGLRIDRGPPEVEETWQAELRIRVPAAARRLSAAW